MPGGSLTEPTRATQPHATVGESRRTTINSFRPLGSTLSKTGIFGSAAEGAGTCSAPAAPARSNATSTARKNVFVISGSFRHRPAVYHAGTPQVNVPGVEGILPTRQGGNDAEDPQRHDLAFRGSAPARRR